MKEHDERASTSGDSVEYPKNIKIATLVVGNRASRTESDPARFLEMKNATAAGVHG